MSDESQGGRHVAGTGDVLILTQYYRPEPNFITADVAEALAAHHRVTVITAHPNYPTGRFYRGTRYWWPQCRVEQGVRVWRLPFIPDHSNSRTRRFISYLSFLVMTGLLAPFLAGRPRVVWVYQTPFTLGLAALWFKWVHSAKILFYCADLWPESFTAAGVAKPGRLMRWLYAYSRWINRHADSILCATKGMCTRYQRDGIPADRLHWVPLWVDGIPVEFAPTPARDRSALPSIVYAGNLGPAQQLETTIRAAAALERDGIDVRFDFYGTGSSEAELRELAATLGTHNVHFHGRRPADQIFAIASRAAGQIVSLRNTPLFELTVPSKLYFCFAAGTPILAGVNGESAQLARESGGAFAFDPDDVDTLVAAVRQLLALTPSEEQARRSQLATYFSTKFARPNLLTANVALVQRLAFGRTLPLEYQLDWSTQ